MASNKNDKSTYYVMYREFSIEQQLEHAIGPRALLTRDGALLDDG